MAKKTSLDRAIDQLDSEITVLLAAKVRLQQEQMRKPLRKPRAAPPKAVQG